MNMVPLHDAISKHCRRGINFISIYGKSLQHNDNFSTKISQNEKDAAILDLYA